MDREPHSDSRAASRWPALALVALLAALAAAVAGVGYLPTHDGPQHVFTVHAAQHGDAPGTGWDRWLAPNFPITNHGFATVFGPLDAWLPWRAALRVALALMVVGWGLAVFGFVRAVRPERAWLGVALAAGALGWPLYMGFFSFYAATALGFGVLALAFGAPRWTGGRRLLLALLLLAQALMHVVPAVLTGGLVTLLALLRAGPGTRLRETGVCLLMGLPAASIALVLAGVGMGALAEFNDEPAIGGARATAPLWTLARCALGGPAWRAWPLTLLALLAPVVALHRGRGALPAEDRALLIGGALLLAGGAFLPLHLPAWDFFSVRFLPLALAALVATLPFERLPGRPRRLAALSLTAFAFAATAWAAGYNRTLEAQASDALAGLDAGVRRDGMRLPIVLEPYLALPADPREAPMPYSAPLLNLGQLYATAQGGLVPYTFMFNPYLHYVVFKAEWREAVDRRYAIDLAAPEHRDDDALRGAILSYLAGRGTAYQDVILWGRPSDVDQLESLGFRSDWRQGGAAIAHFEGCPFTLEFPVEAEISPDATIEIGWLPAWHPTHRYSAGKARLTPDGGRSLPLRQTCGGLWVRLEGTERACQGADAEGRLLVPSTRATPRVICRL
jgi:hypothetical protein